MLIEHSIIFLIVGLIAGMVVGFLGVGSSLVILPVLALMFPHFHIAHAQLMHQVIGTTMACIMVGAIAASIVQLRHRPIHWDVMKIILPAYFIGSMIGPMITKHLNTHELQLYVSSLIILIGLRLLLIRDVKASTTWRQPWLLFLVGLLISLLASTAGIGSGLMLIPFLMKIGVPIGEAISSSLVGAILYTVIGTLSFIINGWAYHLTYSLGFVYVPAFLGISVGVLIGSPFGGKLSMRSSHAALKMVFSIFVIVAGLDLLWEALLG